MYTVPCQGSQQLKEKQVIKLRELFQLNPTIDNPLDELTYAHWVHRVTNICLDAAQMALTAVDISPGMNYLFAPSTTARGTIALSYPHIKSPLGITCELPGSSIRFNGVKGSIFNNSISARL